MMKYQAYSSLPVQVSGSVPRQTTDTTRGNGSGGGGVNTCPPVVAPNTPPDFTAQQQQPYNLNRSSTMKLIAKRNLKQQRSVYHNLNQPHQHRPKTIRASEYRNLREVVPSLRRQRDIGKVEVVTEAARYIDHLHKTLIERFVLCGIPDSLKDVLGTDDANELNSQHIMNLVTQMANKQRQQQQQHASRANQMHLAPNTISARNALEIYGTQRAQRRNWPANSMPMQVAGRPLRNHRRHYNRFGSQPAAAAAAAAAPAPARREPTATIGAIIRPSLDQAEDLEPLPSGSLTGCLQLQQQQAPATPVARPKEVTCCASRRALPINRRRVSANNSPFSEAESQEDKSKFDD